MRRGIIVMSPSKRRQAATFQLTEYFGHIRADKVPKNERQEQRTGWETNEEEGEQVRALLPFLSASVP